MSEVQNKICLPLKDSEKRFLLGIKGEKELLAIALNPSTANEEKPDGTSSNIQKLARNNSCDGWWLVNLYPLRTPHPSDLPKEYNKDLANQNIEFIKNLVTDSSYNFNKVLCCWGNNIDDHDYLRDHADKIIEILTILQLPLLCMALTGRGNPYHPAPTPVNSHLGGINNVVLKQYEHKWISKNITSINT